MSTRSSGSTGFVGDGNLPLAGRSRELEQLRQWLAEAIGGSPRIVLVVGEPGIGKSRVVTELISEARSAGVRPFAGRCLEDARLPLLPLATALDALLPHPTARRAAAARLDADVATSLVADAADALMATASERAAMLVVGDVQWADEPTLKLIAHLAVTLAHEAVFRQLPVVLVVTACPDGAPDAVQRLLSRLARETIGRTLRLEALDDLGVFAMLRSLTTVRPSPQLLAFTQRAARGNPHRIESLVARLSEAGDLTVREGLLVSTTATVELPDVDADPVIDGALAKLTEPGRTLVTTLALLRDERLATLQIASGLERPEFERALDDANEHGVVKDDGGRVGFVRRGTDRALTLRLSGRRQQRMHGQIARRLAETEDHSPFYATKIVDQLESAGETADIALLEKYARPAGDEAAGVGAWAAALRCYEAALRIGHLDARDEANLELRAAVAAYRVLDADRAWLHAARSVELARGASDLSTWGEAALLLAARLAFMTPVAGRARAGREALQAFLTTAGERESTMRALAYASLCEIAVNRLAFDEAEVHAETAARVVAEIDDPYASARVEFAMGLERLASLELREALRHFGRCEQHARDARDPVLEAWALGRRPLALLMQGDLGAATEAAERAATHDRAQGLWSEYAFVLSTGVGIALARGQLAAAERVAVDAASAHRWTEQVGIGGVLWSAVASARMLAGNRSGSHEAVEEWAREQPVAVRPYQELISARESGVGSVEMDAERQWDRIVPLPATSGANLMSVPLACIRIELADSLGRPELVEHATDILAVAYEKGLRFVPGWTWFVPRLAGVGHLTVNDHRASEAWLNTAALDATKCGAVGELARAHFDLARLRAPAGDGGSVDAVLDDARDTFEQLGYRDYIAAVQRLRGRPIDVTTRGAAAVRVIMVTDIVGSTPLIRRVGDHRFVELLKDHNRIVRTRLRQFDGVEFKHTGDGIAAWFLNPSAAVECALRVEDDLERSNAGRTHPLHIRVGMSAGEVVDEEGDLYGIAVVTAFRICDHAGDGRVLASSELRSLVTGERFGFVKIGDTNLKGFAEPLPVYAVARTDS